MKVRELIEQLENFCEDDDVVYFNESFKLVGRINKVEDLIIEGKDVIALIFNPPTVK